MSSARRRCRTIDVAEEPPKDPAAAANKPEPEAASASGRRQLLLLDGVLAAEMPRALSNRPADVVDAGSGSVVSCVVIAARE